MAHHAPRPAKRLARQLAHAQRRCLSISSPRFSQNTASDAASRLLESFCGTAAVRRQTIDGNQLQKLALTLGRPTLAGKDISQTAPVTGAPVPPGYHLVYFTPNGTEADLGADGTDRTFNAPAPFTRRMWAGGRMQWPAAAEGGGADGPGLRVGDEVEERTTLLSATPKRSRSAGEMVLVEVQKEIWGPRGRALVDQRSWVFRPEIDPAAVAKATSKLPGSPQRQATLIEDVPGPGKVRQLRWSPVGLFRFSALTFNGHKIHYNEDWTHVVEGHPGLVVHGPLNLINMLDYWRDVHGQGNGPSEIKYRAMSPLYAGDSYQLRTGETQGSGYEILVEKDGVVCMKGEVVR